MTTAPTSDRDRKMLELDSSVAADIATLQEVRMRLGRRLAALERLGKDGGFCVLGVTTFPQYCEKKGLSSAEGRRLAQAAEACERSPHLRELVEAADVSLPKAQAMGRVLKTPELLETGDDWHGEAVQKTSHQFENLVREREAEARVGEKTEMRTLHLSRQGADDLRRTRDLVSRNRRRPVSDSEAAEVAFEEFVTKHCPEVKAERMQQKSRAKRNGKGAKPKSRSPKGSKNGRSRKIPAGEQRKVIARHGDCCAVDGCDRKSFLDNAHDEGFAAGGSNEAWNLERLCREHHTQWDTGVWRIEEGDGRALLVDRRGEVVGQLRGPEP